MSTVQDDILDRIRGQGRAKVFTPKDFLDLGSRNAADQSLSRLVKGGEIQRLGRAFGYYTDKGYFGEAADLFTDDGTFQWGVDGVYQ